MLLKYEQYPFTHGLGWSSSRFELFDKCKRRYYYNYYGRHASGVPPYRITKLRELTTVALEIGNVVHDVLEAFLHRLQKSDSAIDEDRFFTYGRRLAEEYFSRKTFLEVYYEHQTAVNLEAALEKIEKCLHNFIGSPVYAWIFMKALYNRENWLIEPEGYGETRLGGIKAYCKMDFLFPVDGHIYIMDWKTGKKDVYKHGSQLVGYAAAASQNFGIPVEIIFPKIIYLYPTFEEFEVSFSKEDFDKFFERIRIEFETMQGYCVDAHANIPKPMETFPLEPSAQNCRFCNYQELCFGGPVEKAHLPAFA